ncbi:MAG: transcription-repair coupling factor [Pseudomonadota bacterium]
MVKSATSVTVSGAPEGFDAQILAREAAAGPVIHVARDDKRLVAMQQALAFFAPKIPVMTFPAWDCLPYDRVSPNSNVASARMSTLAALANGLAGNFIVLTTLAAAAQKIPPRELLASASFSATVGQTIDLDGLRAFLVRMGFTNSPTVMEPGDYAIRGGIIDIFPPGGMSPIRLDFFGDVLDGARQFDPMTQRTTEALQSIDLAPMSEVILDAAAITRFRQNYRVEFGAAGTDDPLYEAVSAGRKHQGMEHWLPYFHEKLETIFDYIPAACVTLDDQVQPALIARWDAIEDQYDNRREALSSRARLDTVYKPVPPSELYLDEPSFLGAARAHRLVQLRVSAQATGPGVVDVGGRGGRNFAPERQAQNQDLFGVLAQHITQSRQTANVIVASFSDGARDRLTGLLQDHEVYDARKISSFDDISERAGGLFQTVWPLEEGFEAEGMVVISEQDVLGDRLVRSARRKKRAENFLTETQSLSPGDLIVHMEHGIGRFTGLETVTAAGAPHECILLEYAGGDRLYLPVENVELLSRYGHAEGLLDKLGSGAWQAKKARLKQRIRDMADRLIRVAAERELRKAPVLEPPSDLWDAFCARFPYTETDDQLTSIEAVLEDLAAGRPMDRLVCGDVGFGKTEVAMRAAFVAASAGYQVAVVAPTTLLSRQHTGSFNDRFRGFPLNVRQLSRFVPAKIATQTRAGLADGSVDIAIGTHALLAKQVRFNNLGLLIIDEEQHFGVQHKERLKQLRSDIHVLTLSATPIPRTLQLSLSGVRELSIIGTPPVDRLAIRTYVSEFDTVTIREALLREHYRGGQSFYVVPRVSDLPEIEEFLREQVPEVSVVVAHGQLAPGDLDARMNAFYDGKYDVLLATTIVESGIDIPTANTMIIHRADMFGLSQLYQIRGRVGRSKTRAYAYLTTKPRTKLTPNAAKRLRVLGNLDSLGAGFNIASQDLDIRGAGNVLGEEQSGNVREVGYELYQSMLEEAIAKIRAGEIDMVETDEQWAPVINLGVPVHIPETYVPDLDVRLGLYRRLSGLTSKVELEGFAAELIDRFGALPKDVNTLLLIVRIKAMCKRAGIAKLNAGDKGATVEFHNNNFARPQGLVEFIHDQRGLAKVKDNKIVVRRDWSKESDKIKGAFAIARDLAEKAGTFKPKSKAAPN